MRKSRHPLPITALDCSRTQLLAWFRPVAIHVDNWSKLDDALSGIRRSISEEAPA